MVDFSQLMISGLVMLLTTAAPLHSQVSMVQERGTDEVGVSIEAPSVAWHGIPTIIEITVVNTARDLLVPGEAPVEAIPEDLGRGPMLRRLLYSKVNIPAWSLESTPGPFSIEILDAEGKTIIEPMAPPAAAFYKDGARPVYGRDGRYYPPDTWRPHASVYPGRSHSAFLDLGPWLHELDPGEYQLVIAVYGHVGEVLMPQHEAPLAASAPVPLRVARLPAEAQALIQRALPTLHPDEQSDPRYQDWLVAGSNADVFFLAMPHEIRREIALPLLLGRAASDTGAHELPQHLIDALPDRVRPVADLAQYELLMANGAEAEAAKIRKRLAERHPELTWLLDRADASDGLVARVRALQAREDGAAPVDDSN